MGIAFVLICVFLYFLFVGFVCVALRQRKMEAELAKQIEVNEALTNFIEQQTKLNRVVGRIHVSPN